MDKAKFYKHFGAIADELLKKLCAGEKCESDIISLDMSKRLPFFFNKSFVKQALVRGGVFELDYGSGMFEF